MIHLKPVTNLDYEFLYDMLKEREPYMSIAHLKMPRYEDHVKFLQKKPYRVHYIIKEEGDRIGNIYLTDSYEWGYFILNKYQGKGLGTKAIRLLAKKHPRPYYYSNVNPENKRAIHMARDKFGGKLIQYTYKIDCKNIK